MAINAMEAREKSLKSMEIITKNFIDYIESEINKSIDDGQFKFEHKLNRDYNDEMLRSFFDEIRELGYEIKYSIHSLEINWR